MTGTGETVPAIRPDYPEPLWIQAVNLIRGEIDSGVLKPGMRLPPERELCTQLNISRVTLRKALGKLVDDRVLSSSHGRGWYVSSASVGKEWPNSLESFSETAARMALTASSTVLRAQSAPATLDEAEELSIAPGTPLFHLERIRRLNDVPIAIDATRLPLSLAPDLVDTDFSEASLYERLAAAGVQPARADAIIEARGADAAIAKALGVEVAAPVLMMRQLVLDADDRPLFVSSITYAGDRYRLRTYFSRSRS
ncbi:GntR family transcriptional regulator [Humibacter ginsenosidimutans]|uniref:GntR family transcriptional regulator n=1 Tax=Humibacter ginsenosidimutans TaxID=2599293 RepID=UPI001FEDCD03|nr:GntR family transcriptional regulator [Humibacter ginsenosidimutans]